MSLQKFLSPNFQVQVDPAKFPGNPTIATVASNMPKLCEADYAILAGWFGVAVGAGLGPGNRVIVTLIPDISGAVNQGYSTSHPKISINGNNATDMIMMLFVNEMIEVLMSYKGPWVENDSGGEGLSRLAGNLLHPASAPTGTGANVFGWLASNPATDITAPKAEIEFRQDWITKNFKGGALKQGGHTDGDEDAYSIGCSMLFLSYLNTQLGYTMPQIIQHAGASLTSTYKKLTGDKGGGIPQFRQVIDRAFPSPTVGNGSDNPFPLFLLHSTLPLAASEAVNGNLSLVGGASLHRADLALIKRNLTRSKAIEVTLIAGSSDYTQIVKPSLPTPYIPTALAQTETANGDFLLSDSDDNWPDLYYVKRRNTGSPTNMELHILKGKASYTVVSPNVIIPIDHSDDANGDFTLADFDKDGIPDLVFIKRRATDTGTIELHVLGSKTQYQKFFLHTGTAISTNDDANGMFFVTDVNGDRSPELVFIKTHSTAIPMVEAHILTAKDEFQNFVVHATTMFSTADAAAGSFALGDYNADGWKELALAKFLTPGMTSAEIHIVPLAHWLP